MNEEVKEWNTRQHYLQRQLFYLSPAYNDTAFLPLDIIADTLSCSVYLCDGENFGEYRLIENCPHIAIERYPENSAKKAKEEALAHLKEQLVTAY